MCMGVGSRVSHPVHLTRVDHACVCAAAALAGLTWDRHPDPPYVCVCVGAGLLASQSLTHTIDPRVTAAAHVARPRRSRTSHLFLLLICWARADQHTHACAHASSHATQRGQRQGMNPRLGRCWRPFLPAVCTATCCCCCHDGLRQLWALWCQRQGGLTGRFSTLGLGPCSQILQAPHGVSLAVWRRSTGAGLFVWPFHLTCPCPAVDRRPGNPSDLLAAVYAPVLAWQGVSCSPSCTDRSWLGLKNAHVATHRACIVLWCVHKPAAAVCCGLCAELLPLLGPAASHTLQPCMLGLVCYVLFAAPRTVRGGVLLRGAVGFCGPATPLKPSLMHPLLPACVLNP